MGNKAVLNISKFSLGDSNAMAALLLPTTRLKQDVAQYNVAADISGPSDLIRGYNTYLSGDYEPFKDAAVSLFVYLSALDPGLIEEYSRVESAFSDFITRYTPLCVFYEYYTRLDSWFTELQNGIEGLYDTTSFEAEKRRLSDMASAEIRYQHTGTMPTTIRNISVLYLQCKNLFNDLQYLEQQDEAIDEFFNKFSTIRSWFNDAKSHMGYLGFEEFKEKLAAEEKGLHQFYTLIQCVCSDNHKDEIGERFEELRSMFNGKMLGGYISSSVEYPYFLDLGFDKTTQKDELSDTHGDTMHTVKRELFKGDEWQHNHTKGDMLRIRDMFRVDKLNKISAYESLALIPGIYGFELDNVLEQEDVVSRLVQDESDRKGILGMATTTSGLYLLSDASDSEAAAVKSTAFSVSENGILSTGTFKNLLTPLQQKDPYLSVGKVDSRIGLHRAFGPKSPEYSSGSGFLDWYKSYNGSVITKLGVVQGKESLLRIVGKNSYEWYPSSFGIKYVRSVYEAEEYESNELKSVSHPLSANGLELKAGIGDDNYVAEVRRTVNITVPCNPNVQYSYLDFSCLFHLDQNLSSASRQVSLEFALDDSSPIRFYMIDPAKNKPENISETNPLYESVKYYDPQLPQPISIEEAGRPTHFTFIIENAPDLQSDRTFRISVTADFPALSDIASPSEDVKKAYANTYVLISNPQILLGNVDNEFTYGNYNEECDESEVDDYWNLSRLVGCSKHQYILEVPHRMTAANNRLMYSNYTTATLFSDIITTKNHMDSEYEMKPGLEEGKFTLDRFRNYTGLDACSNTISLYYDADTKTFAELTVDNDDENLAQEYDVIDDSKSSGHPHSTELKYKRIETIKTINRFQHDMKHKSNLFSVRVNNSMTEEMLLEAAGAVEAATTEEELVEAKEKYEEVKADVNNVRTLITSAIEQICKEYAPAHNQLFKVYFE